MALSPDSPQYRRLRRRNPAWLKRITRRLEVGLARGVLGLAALLPLGVMRRLGAGLGRLALLLSRRERNICAYQLEMVFPELGPAGVRRLTRDVFRTRG